MGARWEVKAKEEWKCKKPNKPEQEETRRQVSGKERQIREREGSICKGGGGETGRGVREGETEGRQ